jgi:amino acid transporter
MALAGLILGYIGLAFTVIFVIIIIVAVAHTNQNFNNTGGY